MVLLWYIWWTWNTGSERASKVSFENPWLYERGNKINGQLFIRQGIVHFDWSSQNVYKF